MIKIASLWQKKGKNGTFLAGKLGNASIMIFPNKNKKDPKHPDFEVVIAEDKRDKGEQQQKPVPNRAPVAPAADDADDFFS